MRHYLFTKSLFSSLLCLGLLGLSGGAFAQVYKSYDAEGNVIFSDTPSQGGEEIEVTDPNVSDSFEIPPPAPMATPAKTKSEAEPEPEPVVQPDSEFDPADTNRDGRVSRREREEEREERRRKKREAKKAAEENED